MGFKTPNPRLASDYGRVIYGSKVMHETMQVARGAFERSNILLTGEVGVGKSLIADYLRTSHPRSSQGYTAIEIDIFNQVLEQRYPQRLLRRIANGTLILDKLECLTDDSASIVVEVMERANNVGARTIGLLTPTHSKIPPRDGIYNGLIHIEIPPLRERQEDIGVLVDYFTNLHKTGVHIDRSVLELFHGLNWVGNVRELENTIAKLLPTLGKMEITSTDIPKSVIRQLKFLESGDYRVH